MTTQEYYDKISWEKLLKDMNISDKRLEKRLIKARKKWKDRGETGLRELIKAEKEAFYKNIKEEDTALSDSTHRTRQLIDYGKDAAKGRSFMTDARRGKKLREKGRIRNKQSGGMIGQSDMTAKKVTAPKAKKKIPQYYKGGGKVKKNYAYGGRVAKYKG
jgi:hypothetical protein